MIQSKPYNKDGILHRREVPEGSGAVANVAFAYEEVIQYISNVIGEAAPQVRHRATMWILRATADGVHIDFYDDDKDFYSRLQEETSISGPQIHAGRLYWM